MQRILALGLVVSVLSACATAEDLTVPGADATAADGDATVDARTDGGVSDTQDADAKSDGGVATDAARSDATPDGATSTDANTADAANTADTADALTPDIGAPDAAACAIRGCASGSESRDGCAGARTIGRTSAATASGATVSASTCSAVNNLSGSDSSCKDVGFEHVYKIFMRAGETAAIDVTTGASCDDFLAKWNATLKIYENAGCGDVACTTRTACESAKSPIAKQHTAPRDGWYIIVVDGENGYHEGPYTLTVKLTCAVAGCECG